jgi:metal-responsive CopG/Arc/MetJ family transcriptional regulator
MKRGSVKKRDAQLIPVWMPRNVVLAIDEAVGREDSDRSKFVRNAVRDRINKFGVKIPEAA